MGNIISGLIGIFVGFWMIWKTDWIVQNIGRIQWAEQNLGTEGGSRIFYKLLGLVIIIISFMIMFGLFGGIILSIFSPITTGLRTTN